jgi:hypothetical protein
VQDYSEKGGSFIIVNSFASRGCCAHEVVVVIGSSPEEVESLIMYVCIKGNRVDEVYAYS